MDNTSNKPQTEQTKSQSIPWLRIALWGGFIVAAILTAFLTFSVVRDLVATWQITNLPGVTVKDPTATPAPV